MKQKYGKKTSYSNALSLCSDQEATKTIGSVGSNKPTLWIIRPSMILYFLIDQIETFENIEILAFEDALENENIGLTTNEAQNEAANDA